MEGLVRKEGDEKKKMWRAVFQNKVDAFLAECKRTKGVLPIIISPDIDGVVSSILLSKYALAKFQMKTQLNGTYDCKRIVTVGGDSLVEECLWVDLDLPMKNVMCVGQHLCGKVPYTHPLSFNPNSFFESYETWTKFPFGTAQLFHSGLFETTPYEIGSPAEALLAHCDSTFFNCKKYRPNCKKWVEKMFPDCPFMERLIDNSYEKSMLGTHTKVVEAFEPFVSVKKKYRESAEGWERVRSRQTCLGLKKAPVEGMENLREMFLACEGILGGGEAKVHFRGDPSSAIILWTGRQKVVPLFSERVQTEGLETYLKKVGAQSHAIINSRLLSLTLEEVE